ncbi:M48 family metalloprotease [Maribacter sp. 2308TA10-17]|uniref:M48 family metalloprotease n=1 Tax=Maribacter sp. 2308TA10-17 TaxID=3386276 RepID=UPI0039BD1C40
MSSTYYPLSPTNIPKKLTGLTPSYQFRAFLAILAILLFFILYTAMVVALGYLAYYAIIYDMGKVNKITILLKIGAIAGAVMLFVFTLKFIFKLKNHKFENRIKLEKEKHPKLWSFIHKICEETGAPKPKSIYVDPDVNAYVAYSNMWLSLFLPVRKELTIGMGLTDCLNLSEFKAVISHEFGHFAQRSMKIGSYIISANTIIHDMIFERDKWDDLLDQWRASDIRLSAAAWVITPIIWIIRQMLNLFYQFLNIMYSSLSREMEFNADKVAVSTSGSDAIISALWKLDDGSNNWNSTLNHAYLASQKKMFVKNLYVHNSLVIERGAEKQEELLNQLPDDHRGGKHYFSVSEASKVSMYASHPPNDKREDSAKVPYVVCEEDERSPWLLFGNKEELQEKMTVLLYKQYFAKEVDSTVATEAFEDFIKTETQGTELLEEYDNAFQDRFMHVPEISGLKQAAAKIKEPSSTMLDTLKLELKTLMLPVKEIEVLMAKAQEIAQGTAKENSFSFKGIEYNKKNLESGYTSLLKQREEIFNENFKQWDTSFFALHYVMAEKIGKTAELTNRYQQHDMLSKLYKKITGIKNSILQSLNNLQEREDVTQAQVHSLTQNIKQMADSINDELKALDSISFVPMPNIDTVQELKEAIVEGGIFKREHGNIFENGGFNTMMNRIEIAIQSCQRIDQKSVGSILAFHKELQKQVA